MPHSKPIQDKNLSGFTLVELAIVLVIIGLLVAGVAAGKTLIAGAKVRAVLQELSDLQAATVQFQEKFGELPGDIQDASSYFGCTVGAAPAGCNGNGNESIVWDTAATGVFHEGAMAPYHLQLAGMISSKTLTGQDGTSVIGTNIPVSKLENAGWSFDFWLPTGQNYLQLGGDVVGGAPAKNDNPVLVPKDAYSIDDKVDDGFVNTGRVQALGAAGGACAGAVIGTSVSYNISGTDSNLKQCYLLFELSTSWNF